ncbi:hypothetical protein D3C78_1989610 [compost metagenome]
MQAIRLGATGNARVTRDQCCGARLLDDRHQALGMLLELAIVEPVLRHDHRGDVATLERVG